MEGGSEVSWGSFNTTMSMESELMAQLLGPYPFSSEQDQGLSLGTSSLFWPDSVVDSCYNSQDDNSSSCCWHPENCNATVFSTSVSTSSFFAQPSDYQLTYDVGESNVVSTIEKNHQQMMFNPSGSFGYHACLNEQTNGEEAGDSAIKSSEQVVILAERRLHKRKFSTDGAAKLVESDGKIDIATKSPKKKVQEVAKSPKSKVSQKSNASGEVEGGNANAAPVVHSTSSCSSEDDSNASQEVDGGSTSPISKRTAALNLNGKARASRGSATDPQSLYARRRRERINERLRILQNLVPNGTKVDISTMLEEAVQYVKFLQLQIKLLSSDDLWMYAPLAYNGMDIGLDLKISVQQ